MTTATTSQRKSQAVSPSDQVDVPLVRDEFACALIGDLSETLQDVVGVDEASGFISIVGARMGDRINALYRDAHGVERLGWDSVVAAYVDLKRRIGGDFYVIEQTPDRVVLGNRKCPFGRNVEGRPSLCMMTSNVFGRIAAENLGYSRVRIDEAIARGDAGCRVVIDLRPVEQPGTEEREYFRTEP